MRQRLAPCRHAGKECVESGALEPDVIAGRGWPWLSNAGALPAVQNDLHRVRRAVWPVD